MRSADDQLMIESRLSRVRPNAQRSPIGLRNNGDHDALGVEVSGGV